jgi:hypothetical protein
MERNAHVNALVDANLAHALVIVDVLNHAAQKDARLAEMDASVKYNNYNNYKYT